MKRNLSFFILICFIIPLHSVQKLKQVDRRYFSQYRQISAKLSPSTRRMIMGALRQFRGGILPLHRGVDVQKALDRALGAVPRGKMDVSKAAFLVMMEATRDMDDDIRMIMAEIKKMTKAKQKIRDLIKDLNQWISKEMSKHITSAEDINNQPVSPSNTGHKSRMFKARKLFTPKYKVPYYKAPPMKPIPHLNRLPVKQLRQLLKVKNQELKYLEKLFEAISLRLKLLMDRRAKLIQILANCHKKILASQDQLIDNLK